MNYENDVREGSFETFHKDGKTFEKGKFKADKLHGTYKSYHNNGKLEEESEFKDGEYVGKSKFYNDKGEILREVVYKDGESVAAKFYKDGKLTVESDGVFVYHNQPLPIGIVKTYNDKGQLDTVIDFGRDLKVDWRGEPLGEWVCQGVEACKTYKK